MVSRVGREGRWYTHSKSRKENNSEKVRYPVVTLEQDPTAIFHIGAIQIKIHADFVRTSGISDRTRDLGNDPAALDCQDVCSSCDIA